MAPTAPAPAVVMGSSMMAFEDDEFLRLDSCSLRRTYVGLFGQTFSLGTVIST